MMESREKLETNGSTNQATFSRKTTNDEMKEWIGPKRKYALLFGYNGLKYQGLQINPDAETVEDKLRVALGSLGVIKESNLMELQKIGWSRAARTDKGVHAIGQVVSMKLLLREDKTRDFIEALNNILPKDIQLFDVIRTGNSFNSKFQCFGRVYAYYLPSFILAESLLEQETEQLEYRIDEQKLALFEQCLQKYVGTRDYHNFTKNIAYNDPARQRYVVSFTVQKQLCAVNKCSSETTEQVKDSDAKMELLELCVEGQSFLLNQIRKMVGLAIEVTRRNLKSEVVEDALAPVPGLFVVPRAPGEGLLLKRCLFPTYNRKMCVKDVDSEKYIDVPPGPESSHPIRRPIQFQCGDVVKRATLFFQTAVLPEIVTAELGLKVFSKWVIAEAGKDFPIVLKKRHGEHSDYENYKSKKRKDKEDHKQKKLTKRDDVDNSSVAT